MGQSYATVLSDAFTRVSAATAELRPARPRLVVRLGIRPGLALYGSGGLLPSIEEFRRSTGDALLLAVSVSQPVGLIELLEGKIDAVILRGERKREGIRSRPLVGAKWRGGDDYLVTPEATADCAEITGCPVGCRRRAAHATSRKSRAEQRGRAGSPPTGTAGAPVATARRS